MEENNETMELIEKREYRRRRRMRNQVIAYVSAMVILAGLVVGAVLGVRTLMSQLAKSQPIEKTDDLAEAEPGIIDEPVVMEPPADYVEPEAEPEPILIEEISPLDSIVDSYLSGFTLEDKVAGLFFITPEALTGTDPVVRAGDTTQEKLQEYDVGGLIYFSKNIQSGDQLKEMLGNTKNMSKYPIFLGVDEEGGSVSRVAAANLGEKVGPMGDIGETGDSAKALEAGQKMGTYLSEFGFNVDFAPVADVSGAEDDEILGDRSFGTDPAAVGSMAAAVVSGLKEKGVNACLKHFPGLGNTTEDTHAGMATTESTLEEMQAADFLPFQAGMEAGAAMVMVSHISVPEIVGDNTQASLSPRMINEILRGDLGYDGIVITDALDMGAITEYYTSGEACIKALQAGADMLLMPENFEEAYAEVLKAVQDGVLTEERIDESLRRIYRVKCAGMVEE